MAERNARSSWSKGEVESVVRAFSNSRFFRSIDEAHIYKQVAQSGKILCTVLTTPELGRLLIHVGITVLMDFKIAAKISICLMKRRIIVREYLRLKVNV